jgi:glycosyltransferase involved in cell wall biosynthesis
LRAHSKQTFEPVFEFPGKETAVRKLMTESQALFVVYEFPPEGSRGTKRVLKFIRFLPRNHWSAVVLTVLGPNYMNQDSTLIDELPPGLPVYRARTLEKLFHSNRRTPRPPGSSAAEVKAPAVSSLPRRMALSAYHGLGRFTKIPDSRILWLPFAVMKGFKAIKKNRCRLIYTSGPTHTNHLVGAILSRLTRLPLVIDFRDAWVGNPAEKSNRRLIARSNGFLERFCVRSARFVVCTTDGIKRDFETRYPRWPGKYVTITNGFDQSDFSEEAVGRNRPQPSVLTLVHAGVLGRERSPKEFLMALGQLLREKPDLKGRLEVIFVGKNSHFADGCTIEDYIKQYDCGSAVKLTGFVSRKASLDYMMQSDLLLLIIGRVPMEGAFVYGISGKLYDYAAAGKPVLTIAEPGSTAELAQRLSLGPVVHPDATEEIKSAILSYWEGKRSGAIPYQPNVELLKEFDFSSLTARLAECFDEACQGQLVRT